MTINPTGRLRPINVGNVVSVGISLYRTNFKTYSGLAFKSLLWYIVPIYGWARSLMILGQIGRLGFKEMVREPETVNQSLRQVVPRMWAFLGIAILVGLIQFGINIGLSVVRGIVSIPLFFLVGAGDAGAAISGLLQLVLLLVFLAAQIWFQARFWLYDLSIAVETDTEATQAISRSWQLTQGSSFRVQLVFLIAYLIMLPLIILTFVPFLFTIPYFATFSPDNPDPTFVMVILLATLVFLLLLFAISIITVPFWQSVKTALYYDCRSRKEGLDLELKNRKPL